MTVVTSDTMLYGYACTLQGIEEAAREKGHLMSLPLIVVFAVAQRKIISGGAGK